MRPQLKIVVPLDPARQRERHLAYAGARRTLCLEVADFRQLRGRGQRAEPDCGACAAARERVKVAMVVWREQGWRSLNPRASDEWAPPRRRRGQAARGTPASG
jgi:hypothetical protein